MAVFVPVDLFGNYLAGARAANADNWNDLSNYNTVENGIMKNQLFKDTFNDQVNNSHATTQQNMNNANRSSMDLNTYGLGQPGRDAISKSNSDYQVDYANSSKPLISTEAQNNANAALAGTSYNLGDIQNRLNYQAQQWANYQAQQEEQQRALAEERQYIQQLLAEHAGNAGTGNTTGGTGGTGVNTSSSTPSINDQLMQLGKGLNPETPTPVNVGGTTYTLVKDKNGNVYTVDSSGKRTAINPDSSLYKFPTPPSAPSGSAPGGPVNTSNTATNYTNKSA